MKPTLFVYGTLQASEVVAGLIGRIPQSESATLMGYGCYRVEGADYPGITPESNRRVAGLLYSGLTKKDFVLLDRFEGELYSRVLISVQTDAYQTKTAWAYVIRKSCRYRLTSEPWHYEDHIENFLAKFRRFKMV